MCGALTIFRSWSGRITGFAGGASGGFTALGAGFTVLGTEFTLPELLTCESREEGTKLRGWQVTIATPPRITLTPAAAAQPFQLLTPIPEPFAGTLTESIAAMKSSAVRKRFAGSFSRAFKTRLLTPMGIAGFAACGAIGTIRMMSTMIC